MNCGDTVLLSKKQNFLCDVSFNSRLIIFQMALKFGMLAFDNYCWICRTAETHDSKSSADKSLCWIRLNINKSQNKNHPISHNNSMVKIINY